MDRDGEESGGPPASLRFPAIFEPLTDAEKRVLEAAARGVECVLGEAPPPEGLRAGDPRRLEAGFIRALLMAQDAAHRIHEAGLRISGALVVGRLNLTGCPLPRALSLTACRFEQPVALSRAETFSLTFDGSVLPGLYADRARIKGSLYLRAIDADRPFVAEDSVSCVGVKIESDLSCRGGVFTYSGRLAKDAARLIGARRERLDEYEAAISIHMAEIGGALDLSEAQVRAGSIDLALARAHTLRVHREDVHRGFAAVEREGEGPAHAPRVLLDGLAYEFLPIAVAGDPKTLEELLTLQPEAHLGVARLKEFRSEGEGRGESREEARVLYRIRNRFRPQPFEMAVSALRAMGHDDAARRIALFKQRRRRRARGEFTLLGRIAHWAFGVSAGYGYRPSRAMALLLALWLAGGGVFLEGYRSGGLAPAEPEALLSETWRQAREEAMLDRSAGLAWSEARGVPPPGARFARAAPSYPRFEALAYSADLMLPFVELGQDRAWAPDASTPVGRALHYYRFAHIVLGLALSALAVASLTVLVQRF